MCLCVCVCGGGKASSPSIAYAENHDKVKNNELSNDVLQNMRKMLTVVSTEKCAIIILERESKLDISSKARKCQSTRTYRCQSEVKVRGLSINLKIFLFLQRSQTLYIRAVNIELMISEKNKGNKREFPMGKFK